MIPAVDSMIRTLLTRAAGTPTPLIGLQPPDGDWAQRVSSFRVNDEPVTCLNAYLADVRENRRLRTNAESFRSDVGGTTRTRAPMRVDLHYLISAWHPRPDSDSVPATAYEHALLSQVVAEFAITPLNSDLLLTTAQSALVPDAMRSVDLPLSLLPVDGFPRLGEFWSAMGRSSPWRPTCYVVVTMPVATPSTPVGGIVEAVFADMFLGTGMDAEVLPDDHVLGLGGVVSSGGAPLPGAAVQLRGVPGGAADGFAEDTIADDDGRFAFSGLRAADYRLLPFHPSRPTLPPVEVTLPLAGGRIDLVL